MRVPNAVVSVAALIGSASAQYTASKYYEASSGITYSSITLPNGVSYRIALPVDTEASDAILQIVSPVQYGWCGLAWGGHMTNNPLSVGWATKANAGSAAIVSSRLATSYSLPNAYGNATYTYLKQTSANSTHWTVAARCQGCTQWSSANGDYNLQQQSQQLFSYACSTTAPTTPTSNTSTFSVHDTNGIWTHDLDIAKNASFATWVAENVVTTSEEEKIERDMARRFYA